MSDGLDTSVVLRLLTGQSPAQAEAARAFVASAAAPVFVSDLVIGETYFALMHHYGAPHIEAVRALSGLLADARVQSSGVARAVLGAMAQGTGSRNASGLLDQLIHADYARDEVSLATFEKGLARLPGVQLLK